MDTYILESVPQNAELPFQIMKNGVKVFSASWGECHDKIMQIAKDDDRCKFGWSSGKYEDISGKELRDEFNQTQRLVDLPEVHYVGDTQ